MPLVRDPKNLAVHFDGGELAGLNVEFRPVGRKTYRAMTQLLDEFKDNDRPTTDEQWDSFERVCAEMEKGLVSWDLENSSGAVECNAEQLELQGIEFTLNLIIGWVEAIDEYSKQLTATAEATLETDQ